MANHEHLEILNKGVQFWNTWRKENPEIRPDLYGSHLGGRNLSGIDFSGALLRKTNISGANLDNANLTGANLREADIGGSVLQNAKLNGAILDESNLILTDFQDADLTDVNLMKANLTNADFRRASLVRCQIFGISSWGVRLHGALQSDLIITPPGESRITLDNLEVAQFIYLLLNNENIRDAIDTIGKKAVLLLGRFSPERKEVLNALKDELRKRDYLPILFDFEGPECRDLTETVSTLAHLARFIIADLTEPSSIPKELEAIVPTLAVPVQPILLNGQPYAMFNDYWKYHWVLEVYQYEAFEKLLSSFDSKVIAPAEAKAFELDERRKAAMLGR